MVYAVSFMGNQRQPLTTERYKHGNKDFFQTLAFGGAKQGSVGFTDNILLEL